VCESEFNCSIMMMRLRRVGGGGSLATHQKSSNSRPACTNVAPAIGLALRRGFARSLDKVPVKSSLTKCSLSRLIHSHGRTVRRIHLFAPVGPPPSPYSANCGRRPCCASGSAPLLTRWHNHKSVALEHGLVCNVATDPDSAIRRSASAGVNNNNNGSSIRATPQSHSPSASRTAAATSRQLGPRTTPK
jgi:hypothetical protein